MCYAEGWLDNTQIKEKFISLAHAIDEIEEWTRQGKKIRGMKVHTIATNLKANPKPYKVIDQN